MNEDVALLAVLDEGRAGARVARDDDRPVGRLELIAERLPPLAVRILKSCHLDVGVLEDEARDDIVSLDGQARRASMFETGRTDVDVGLPRGHDVARHRLNTLGTVHPERTSASLHPGREDQVWIPDRVVGVKMGDERRLQLVGRKSRDTFVERGGGAPHETWADVDQICRAVHDDRGGRTRSLRIGPRRSGAKQHNLCMGFARRRNGEQQRDKREQRSHDGYSSYFGMIFSVVTKSFGFGPVTVSTRPAASRANATDLAAALRRPSSSTRPISFG